MISQMSYGDYVVSLVALCILTGLSGGLFYIAYALDKIEKRLAANEKKLAKNKH